MSLLPAEQRRTLLSELSDDDCAALLHDWRFWARPDQIAPAGEWRTWLVLAGRGWGKTRVGAEWVRESVRKFGMVNVIAPTADDARDIMVEGESGILAICPDGERPQYLPSKRRLEWPNGARTLIFTADEPDRLRGKQHMRLWADELAAWRYPEAWDQAMMGLRLGADPRVVATTTPRPIKSVTDLLSDPTTIVTRGNTYDNAENLAPAFLDKIIRKYEGTRLGRQELLAELLLDVPGALWTRAMLDNNRVAHAPDLERVVVAVDPSGGHDEENDEQGIVVAGRGVDARGYVVDDRSCKLSPNGWGRRAVQAYVDHQADRIVYEKNFGGEMVEAVIQTAARDLGVTVATKAVHASRGKVVRAEPIAALDEQGRVSHVGMFAQMEDELCTWTPASGVSPNRLDARVWALTELLVDGGSRWGAV
jgi:predicted phage terminase large subunit-like protein